MSRKNRIVVAFVSLGLAPAVPAVASPAAFAGSPLLSGYGGPGAGEQAVIGSTLIGGSGGGAGSGGSGSASNGAASVGGGSGSTASGSSSTTTGGSPAGGSAGVGTAGKGVSSSAAGRTGGSHAAGSVSARGGASSAGATRPFVYPTELRSASVDSPELGISGSDLLLFGATIATLALVGVATLRLSRLQR